MVWVRFKSLPRPLSGIIVGVVYNPPDTSAQEESELVSYIIHTLDQVCTAHPDCGIVILGDFNKLNIDDVLANYGLKQVVQDPTRGGNILDLIVTNLAHYYSIPIVTAPLGTLDHCMIKMGVNNEAQ